MLAQAIEIKRRKATNNIGIKFFLDILVNGILNYHFILNHFFYDLNYLINAILIIKIYLLCPFIVSREGIFEH